MSSKLSWMVWVGVWTDCTFWLHCCVWWGHKLFMTISTLQYKNNAVSLRPCLLHLCRPDMELSVAAQRPFTQCSALTDSSASNWEKSLTGQALYYSAVGGVCFHILLIAFMRLPVIDFTARRFPESWANRISVTTAGNFFFWFLLFL